MKHKQQRGLTFIGLLVVGGLLAFTGVVVAQLQGSELVGRGVIEHRARNGSGCWNPLNRSMIIGSEIVTIGLDQMQFTDRATLEPRDAVRWGDPEQYGCYYWTE